MAAGLPAGAIRAETRMLVSSTTRIRLYLRSGTTFGADLSDGLIDDALNLESAIFDFRLP